MKHYNKFPKILCILTVAIVIASVFTLIFTSCNKKTASSDETKNMFDIEQNIDKKKVGVFYFSVTGNTKVVAEKIASIFDTDANEIIPEVPYTKDDILFEKEDSRAALEDKIDVFNDSEESVDEYETSEGIIIETTEANTDDITVKMPKIKNLNVKKYEIIFLGFPIWYDDAPKVIYTFLQNKDLKNKTIIPFCTSDNSPFGNIDQYFANFVDESNEVMSGERFARSTTVDEIKNWIAMLSADIGIYK